MKKLAILAAALLAASAWAQSVYVAPHVRSDGTFVQGHVRSAPDHSRLNNYSTQGNYNPYTGQAGTVNPYQPPSGSMYQPQPLPQLPQLPRLPRY
jgi:hypothetical protein